MSALTLTLKANGRPLKETIELLAVDVVREINRISRAQLVLIDGDLASRRFALSDSADFAPGQEIEVLARYEGDQAGNQTLFKGIVVGQRVEGGPQGTRLTVDLKDRAVRLTVGRQTRILNDKTDSQIMNRLIGDHGLKKGKIQATSLKHPELVQYQISDWDFLLLRAEANGLVVVNEDGQLSVVAPDATRPARHHIEAGLDELFDFEMRLDTSDQTSTVSAAAWDIRSQQLRGSANNRPVSLKQGQLKPGEITAMAGSSSQIELDGVAAPQPEELQPWVDGTLLRQRLGLLQGRLSLSGSAAYRLLDPLAVSGIGRCFNGTALITALRQRLTTRHGWITDVQLGLSPQSFASRPDIQPPPAGGLLAGIRGLHIGLASDFKKDPDGQFRLQVRLYGDKELTVWARLAAPDAGKDHGFVFWPEANDEVVVGFVNEDPRQAVVLGSLFSQKNRVPPDLAPTENNLVRGLVTKKNNRLLIIDDDKAELLLKTSAGKEIHLNENEDSLTIKDEHGNEIVLDKDGIKLKSGKDLTLEASGKVEIKGQSVDLK
ncbi:MAG: type VI secretion system tip protein VgrG [Anaerolineales bacterium]|nr:type VI secretion system tip protein VgrG [Anaerolineales bacterium]